MFLFGLSLGPGAIAGVFGEVEPPFASLLAKRRKDDGDADREVESAENVPKQSVLARVRSKQLTGTAQLFIGYTVQKALYETYVDYTQNKEGPLNSVAKLIVNLTVHHYYMDGKKLKQECP